MEYSFLIEYKIKEGKEELTKDLINIYLEEIEMHEPQTTCTIFKKEDNVSFLHFIEFPDRDAEEKHFASDYTKQFLENLKELSEGEIVISKVEKI